MFSIFGVGAVSAEGTESDSSKQLKTYYQSFTTDTLGQVFLTGPISTRGFSKISVMMTQWPPANLSLSTTYFIGKISGQTLAESLGTFPLANSDIIHTFDVIGPEFSVVLTGGPANATVPIQGWVYLH
jgi:hypothetical protein